MLAALSVVLKMFYNNIEEKAAVPLPEWNGGGIEGLDSPAHSNILSLTTASEEFLTVLRLLFLFNWNTTRTC